MPEYIDLYFLGNDRNSENINLFLNRYLPERKESISEYIVPQFSTTPERVFNKVDELMKYLMKETNLYYSIYWSNQNKASKIQHAMIFYTDDGKVIYGISAVGTYPFNFESIQLFEKIKKELKSDIGCITVEEPPPTNSAEFEFFCLNRFS